MGRTGGVGGETKTEKYDWEIVEETVEKIVNGESVNIQYMWHPWDTKKDFVYEVYYVIKNNRIVINNECLPEWLVSELVAKKLEES